ncbi:MAG: phosphoribosylformylglycinamidine synthase subunit PurL [Candidatus Schekmanbacteria bacterium]|nr:MAG: phosphoribosylformylglycinamidine synthase subunit PurL [Candidatus Schekmanbacteria bacterium]
MTDEIIESHGLTKEDFEHICSILGRKPNYTELGIFSVMWSEHCSYKSSKPHLKNFPTSAKWVIQGPGENAGIIDIGDGLAAVFKIESHNHPSFIEPYQGAATGVGGILRDIFTMGARPVANLNSLRFGNVNNPRTRYIIEEVVAGIAGYGNCMGIPTVGGEVYFDECYDSNPLVNAFTLGVAKKDNIFYGVAKGVDNPVIYIGSRTGRDGIHGATMASEEFDEGSEERRPTVQVGDPFTEKLLLEACLELMEKKCILGIQDMGAAGLTCSTAEMASRAGTGIEIELNKVPLREEKMTPYEIMLSESQERMLLVTEKGREKEVLEILKKWDLEAAVIGRVTDSRRFVVKNNDSVVADIPVKSLTDDIPIPERPIKKPDWIDELRCKETDYTIESEDVNEIFEKILLSPDIVSREWIYDQYDHMVGINTVELPGSDAAVIRLEGSKKGLALSLDGNGRYCFLNPYEGGKKAVAESARNISCSGALPLAITNCLNFGNPERPDVMWQFSETVKGMAEACKKLETPVVSGNVSFYNETIGKGVYPTPVIGMVGILEDVAVRCNQAFKNEGDIIVLLGESGKEMGGSLFQKVILGKVEGKIPICNLDEEMRLQKSIRELISLRIVNSAHDISDGGLAIAIAEMSFSSKEGLGAEIEIKDNLPLASILFGESPSRIIATCKKENLDKLNEFLKKSNIKASIIGKVIPDFLRIKITNDNTSSLIEKRVFEIEKKWKGGFKKLVAR